MYYTEAKKKRSSCFTSLKYEIVSYARHLLGELGVVGLIPSCLLFEERIRYPLDQVNMDLSETINRFLSQVFPEDMAEKFEDVYHSRVAASIEGGGKRRLFIIGNYVQQRLLRPYHDWAMSVLRRLPQDGTYNQTKPLQSLVGFKDIVLI